ncbi:hypothetical protein QQ73_18705, partial [Candidatus Endoriftia persephone str. Guaymas]|nr:hypothetical protein [Candidatus Endoriftia persephone str. Guaymas]
MRSDQTTALLHCQQQPDAVDNRFILICDARIDNRDELQDQLPGFKKATGTFTDADITLAAFRKWGYESPQHLIGDFAFVLWDREKQTLFAARDGMQMRTLSFARVDGTLCLASEGQQLLGHPRIRPKISELGMTGWLSGWPDLGVSLFDGIEVLPAGHSLVADAHGVTVSKFWDIDPEYRIRYRQISDYQEHLEALLYRCVLDRMHSSSNTIATQMSGGMDSTSVTALASREAAKHHTNLVVISHSYSATESCDETDRIHETLRHLNIQDSRFLAAEQHAHLDFRMLYPPTLE